MTEFEGREKAFEKKFELDEELRFKTTSRAAKLFGNWAALQLGLKGTEIESYIKSAVELSTLKTGHDQLLAKVEQDIKTKGLPLDRSILEKEMRIFLEMAHQQIVGKS